MNNGFEEPTDAEISALYGVPVISLRPEDLPHFDPLRTRPYSGDELADRVRGLRDKILDFYPGWDRPDQELRRAAASY